MDIWSIGVGGPRFLRARHGPDVYGEGFRRGVGGPETVSELDGREVSRDYKGNRAVMLWVTNRKPTV